MPLTAEQKKQAMKAANMTVVKNGGVEETVNYATEDFCMASRIMKRCTEDYSKAYNTLPDGMRLFVHQQIFRINAAAFALDALGYQMVTNMLVSLHPDMDRYMRETMRGWSEIIDAEGEVQRVFEELKKEEDQQGNPSATVQ